MKIMSGPTLKSALAMPMGRKAIEDKKQESAIVLKIDLLISTEWMCLSG